MEEEKKTMLEKLHAISTPAEENWLEIADKWEEEDKVLEELIKYFQGLWPGMETAEQCNTDMHFTPPAIMRLAKHFYELGKQSKEPVSEDLEEAAEKHLDTVFGKGKHQPFYKELFIAGAEWQKEQDQPITGNSLEQEWLRYIDKEMKENRGELPALGEYGWLMIARHFANWQKSQMLKDAVKGKVVSFKDGHKDIALPPNTVFAVANRYEDGDKVKILIIPEKED